MNHVRFLAVLLFGLLLGITATAQANPSPVSPATGPQAANGTAFTYQGRLTDGGAAANGAYDFQFILYNAAVGGAQTGPIVTQNDVPVSGGLFNTTLDFGAVFNGTALYLEIAVRPGSSGGSYTPLSPRQALTPAPYAHYATRAGIAASATSAQTATSAISAQTAIMATSAQTATSAISAQTAITATALILPFTGSASSSGTLFGVTNTGTGQAAEFGSDSGFVTLFVGNSGEGGAIRADTSDTGKGSAVTGYNYGTDRYAAEFEIIKTTNPRAAIYARTAGTGQAIDAEVNSSTTADALFARTTSPTAGSYAGVFSGPVQISCSAATCNTTNALQVVGNFAASTKTFKIDHPLDPANKYLNHSTVESPDMKNIYDGVITTDADGFATVVLPDYFEALNQDFRYQLTVMGTFAQAIVRDEIANNRFTIQTDKPNVKVSWQVTGIRHDAYAKAYPIPVEEDKPSSERGRYLFPELFGQPKSRSISAASDSNDQPAIQPQQEER
jgi:hypothetical protein